MSQAKIPLFKVLCNVSCGSENFSDEFFSELFTKTYCETYHENLDENGYFQERWNPKVVELYERLGKEESEHKYSSLIMAYFPLELKDYLDIQIWDGREILKVDTGKLYRNFYVEAIQQKNPLEELQPKYERLEYVMETYKKSGIRNMHTPNCWNPDLFCLGGNLEGPHAILL